MRHHDWEPPGQTTDGFMHRLFIVYLFIAKFVLTYVSMVSLERPVLQRSQ